MGKGVLDLINHEILNGVSAIQKALSAFTALREDVTDPNALEEELLWLLEGLCVENPALMEGRAIQNENASSASSIGSCSAALPAAGGAQALLSEKLPLLAAGGRLTVPVEVDFTKGLAMALEVDGEAGAAEASVMAQYVLLSMLQANQALNFRCGDMVMGGSFFSSVHGLIAQFPKMAGGRVCTKPEDMDSLLKDLESAASETIAALGGAYSSVLEYNQSSTVKLTEYVNVLYMGSGARMDDLLRRLRLLVSNRRKNGKCNSFKDTHRQSALTDTHERRPQPSRKGKKILCIFSLAKSLESVYNKNE